MMLFSLVFVTFFDTTGTLMALGRQCGFIDEEGQAVGIENAFLADAVGGSLGIAWGFVVYAVASLASGKAKELGWGIWLMVIVFIIYLFFGL